MYLEILILNTGEHIRLLET